MGVRVGLRWEAVPVLAQALAIPLTEQRVLDLRAMENEALAVWHEKSS